ncbi:uncharacterized protein LOC132015488 [Mustela nigripes]|uniref:uncharacterized protein LOC132015488 n=1 Tax=Mustela nigripes TaxID=77151 RepID=UPI0028149BE4|nr:uncharacterized protein LOC132015488 [Mustela nigripes]
MADGTPRVAGKSKCCNLSETTTAAGAETTRGFRLHDRHRFSSLTSASQDPSDSRTSGAGNGPPAPHGTPGDTERSLHLAILDEGDEAPWASEWHGSQRSQGPATPLQESCHHQLSEQELGSPICFEDGRVQADQRSSPEAAVSSWGPRLHTAPEIPGTCPRRRQTRAARSEAGAWLEGEEGKRSCPAPWERPRTSRPAGGQESAWTWAGSPSSPLRGPPASSTLTAAPHPAPLRNPPSSAPCVGGVNLVFPGTAVLGLANAAVTETQQHLPESFSPLITMSRNKRNSPGISFSRQPQVVIHARFRNANTETKFIA